MNRAKVSVSFFRINTSIQLRSSLITINSLAKWFLYRGKLLSFRVVAFPSFDFFWTYKLGKSLYYIRFIWCVVYTNDGGLPQTMFESQERKTFPPSPPHAFIFLIKLIREERREKGQIKDILSEFFPLLHVRITKVCFWKSCPKCVMETGRGRRTEN